MILPKNYFNNLTANKYREYLKLLPNIQKENTRIIVTLILTFAAMSFFGIFAINPTLSTIVKLKKQLSDSKLAYESLKTKTANLSSLQEQYAELSPDLPLIYESLPQDANAPTLLSQIMGLASEERIKILSLETSLVQLSDSTEQSSTPVENKTSYTFSLKVQGTYNDLISFTRSLTQINRIIKVESISINKDAQQNTLTLDLSGRTYFQK